MDLSNKGFAQAAAVIVGAGYLVGGLVGFFVTGFDNFVSDTDYTLLSLDINPFHNVFHVFVGAYLIIIAQFGRPATEGALIGGGAVYLVAVFLGLTDNLQILSMQGAGATDNILHTISGSAALGVGLLSVSRNARSERLGDPLQQR